MRDGTAPMTRMLPPGTVHQLYAFWGQDGLLGQPSMLETKLTVSGVVITQVPKRR